MAVHQLPAEVGTFARYLEELTGRLDPAGGWCAIFWQRDPDGMRACLEGIEIPPWDVVESLLHDLATPTGPEHAEREWGRARALHAAAAAAHDRLPGGREALEERRELMRDEQAYAAARAEELLRSLAGEPEGTAEAERLTHELSWTRDDHTRATSRVRELTSRLESLPHPASWFTPAGPDATGPAALPGPAGPGEQGPDGPWPTGMPGAAGAYAMETAGSGQPVMGGSPDRQWAAGPAGPTRAGTAGMAAAPGRAGATGTAETGADGAAAPGAPRGHCEPGRAGPRSAPAGADHGAPGADAGPYGTGRHGAPVGTGASKDAAPVALPGYAAGGTAPHGAGPGAPNADTAPYGVPGPGRVAAGEPAERGASSRGKRKARRGARFAGVEDDDGGAVAVPVLPVAGDVPRGARYGGAAAAPAPAPPPEPAHESAGAERAARETVAALGRLRAEGRGGEAHVVLCEAAARPPGWLPALAAELHRGGLDADWSTLLWEVASQPAAHLAAAADALAAAGRPDDGRQLLRQGVSRPAEEIAETAIALADEGLGARARALLAAYAQVRPAEDAARVAGRDPARLVPALLDAARDVSPDRERDLVHALRVAGYLGA
ncbi:hypothetical protein HW130_10090 [Streptomyces sp. PKU-EA00015]|uniref:hypothetical protein n=1 Tax=Streptomyces sp. PKU-EA00015 TaxID=2748326 RepID=UPI0015A2F22C|nr:hypothetical protein [Streptomyces sp. PKU-EA00015]NWF26620.1 hypothetical protein [Streptomyces sp. PKU-EA00015]